MAHVAREMERARLQAAAADRRRDDLARAHRGEDRAELLRPGGLRARRLAQRVGVCTSLLVDRTARGLRRRGARRLREGARAARDEEGPRPSSLHGRGARERGHKIDWASYAPPQPAQLRPHGAQATTRSPSSSRYIDWGPFFQAWDLAGRIRRSSTTRWSARPRATCFARSAGDARAHRARKRWLTANGVFGL